MSSSTSLVVYLRSTLDLRGTKYMCLEGGCGACIVAVSKHCGAPIQAINSCLVSIASCHGWEITTIEKIGNRLIGYHPLQKTLAESNGSQCGHCSAGFVMSMYRGFKDMQEEREICDKELCHESDWCLASKDQVVGSMLYIPLSDERHWYVVQELSDVFDIFQERAGSSYMLVAGNTAKGVYPRDEEPEVLIDISRVYQLKHYELDQNLVLGAGNT